MFRFCTVSRLPRHNAAHSVTMLRRPVQPRAGSLQPSHVVTWKEIENRARGHPAITQIGDAMMTHTGQLEYWRDMVTKQLLRHESNGRAVLPSAWECVVPLLESIRDAGRIPGNSNNNNNNN